MIGENASAEPDRPSAADYRPGDVIEDRWHVRKALRGGMGVVYFVWDEQAKETLAAKTYRDDVGSTGYRVAERFEREALAWVQIGPHLNIVKARFVRRIKRVPFLFLEYAGGGTLRALLPTIALSGARPGEDEYYERAEVIQSLAVQLCDGMIHAAHCGVTAHRDIKPENCLIAPSPKMNLAEVTRKSIRFGGWVLKITDFGLAKVFEGPAAGVSEQPPVEWGPGQGPPGETVWVPREAGLELLVTGTGEAAGTVTHMAPEQFDDLKRVDTRGDIYSFGVVLHQMVTGELPFKGRSIREYKHLHQTASPPAPGTAFPGLNVLIARCLEKSPADRFADFGEVRAALEGAVHDRHETDLQPPPHLPRRPGAVPRTGEEERARAASLAELRLPERAVAVLDEWLAQAPDDGKSHAQKGILLMNALHRYGTALVSLERARELGEQGLEKRIAFCRHKLA